MTYLRVSGSNHSRVCEMDESVTRCVVAVCAVLCCAVPRCSVTDAIRSRECRPREDKCEGFTIAADCERGVPNRWESSTPEPGEPKLLSGFRGPYGVSEGPSGVPGTLRPS